MRSGREISMEARMELSQHYTLRLTARRLSALAALLLLGCSGTDSSISGQITAQVEDSRKSGFVDLSVVGPSSWERMCVLTPYTTNEMAAQVLGFNWDAESKTSITGSDVVNALVFIHGQHVVAYTEHPRSTGDFSKLQPRCLPRSHAKLVRDQGTGD